MTNDANRQANDAPASGGDTPEIRDKNSGSRERFTHAKWSRGRPTEPGWYWAHDGESAAAVKVAKYLGGGGDILRIEGHDRIDSVRFGRWLWWPVAITPPEGP